MDMDREWEVEHLHLADDHIAMAERHVTKQRLLVERLRTGGHDAHEAERLLGTMEGTLEAFREHRQSIADAIDRIDARRA
ncbi:hypothetical protein ACRAWG_11220 [Methylobacterium sp. P31]